MRKIIFLFISLFCVNLVNAQEKLGWEFGIGGSVHQFNRLTDFNYQVFENQTQVIGVDVRQVVYSGNLMTAKPISNVFTIDFNANLGKMEDKMFGQAGLGLQWRLGHYFKSSWIDPYLRVGGNAMYKPYQIQYIYNDGLTGWQLANDANKEGRDKSWLFPISAGVGVNMWLNDHIGLGLGADYLYIANQNVANPIQGTARILFRFGGKSKKPKPVVEYVERVVEKQIEVEKVVEKVVEKIVYEKEIIDVSELLSNITFDFDSYELQENDYEIIQEIANILLDWPNACYLISGYTDAMGGSEYNNQLSVNRANAIRNALINFSVNPNMLKIRGYGKKVANMSTFESEFTREGDRKVTIELIKNEEYWNKL